MAENGKLTLESIRTAVVDHFTSAGTERMEEAEQVRALSVRTRTFVSCPVPLPLTHLAYQRDRGDTQIGAQADAAMQRMIAEHFLVREEVLVDEDSARYAALSYLCFPI